MAKSTTTRSLGLSVVSLRSWRASSQHSSVLMAVDGPPHFSARKCKVVSLLAFTQRMKFPVSARSVASYLTLLYLVKPFPEPFA